jgi:hypothetical protein
LSFFFTPLDVAFDICVRALVGLVGGEVLSLRRQSTALGALYRLLRTLGQVDVHHTLIRVMVGAVLTIEWSKLADIFLMLADFIPWERFLTPLAVYSCEVAAAQLIFISRIFIEMTIELP